MTGILLITTAGTIDKLYFDASSDFPVGESIAADILSMAQVASQPRIVEVMRKDSLDLTDADRECIRSAVVSAEE